MTKEKFTTITQVRACKTQTAKNENSFDKAGNCTDGGMTYSASRGIGVDFSAGERINIKKNLGYVGDELGWRFGINSGVSFTEPGSPFDKKETPLNKNVKIYNRQ